ncbi:hypothetical protein ACFL6S_09265 [Candidatus Poribacteria bacterium]
MRKLFVSLVVVLCVLTMVHRVALAQCECEMPGASASINPVLEINGSSAPVQVFELGQTITIGADVGLHVHAEGLYPELYVYDWNLKIDGSFLADGGVSNFIEGYGALEYTPAFIEIVDYPLDDVGLHTLVLHVSDAYAGAVGASAYAEGVDVSLKFTVVEPDPVKIIDIKPGSDPNSINLGANGVVPVAILSSADFDATTVDPDTVALAGAGVAVRGKGNKSMSHEEDVNGDGLIDLVLQVETENLDPDAFQDGYACLTGTTFDGTEIEGCDEIIIVPPQ